MSFQKINIRDRYKKVVFFLGVSLRQSNLNEPKNFFYQLPSWDFIFFKTLTIILYENTKKNKNFGVPAKKKPFFTIGP
jgi:hypothetical protein